MACGEQRSAGLRWLEVDPTLHPFDPTGVAALVRPLLPARRWRDADPDRFAWVARVDHALRARFGPWAQGWCWGDGGPVRAWCCPGHSYTTQAETADRVETALREFRGWLEHLAARFEELAPPVGDAILPGRQVRVVDHGSLVGRPAEIAAPKEARAGLEQARAAFERATPVLVADVVERTRVAETWYGHCEQVLGWFLERLGLPDGEALAEAAIGGRFESWTAPDGDLVEDVARDLASAAAERLGAREDDP